MGVKGKRLMENIACLYTDSNVFVGVWVREVGIDNPRQREQSGWNSECPK